MDFRTKLIEIRRAKGLTHEDFAESCKLNVRTIQRIESGHVQPRAQTIKLICDALDIDFYGTSAASSHPFIWQIKNLFNFKSHKMEKITILSSSALIIVFATFVIGSKTQAQSPKPVAKSGLTISYNEDQTIKRVDAVFTTSLTLDSVVAIAEALEDEKIIVSYKSLEFNEQGYLESIECEVTNRVTETGGSFEVKNLSTIDKNHSFGFYYDYSEDAETSFCSGSCW